ncbi:hypothetical protein ACFYNL_17650 [Streptomyces sp. NPDC007808]|uniref:hypothetical protein n=1 Tax=Streptomyces sp. NPDC007808 TaxID=3364779 RepID=UPI0036B69661
MPGTVLLLAAAPAGKGCLVDAASVLPVLAAVPPAVLSGADTANVVELADPLEPQAVLTRLRAAAAAPGPLTVFVTGQLQLDRRQHLPHLALARTTPSTVRYTGFPWHWIREELRLRAPGSTSLLLDLHADAETWEWLRANPLDSGRNNVVYGRVAPPPHRRTVAGPVYMKAVATLLRSGHRPPLDQLHQEALSRIAPEAGVGTDIVLTAQSAPQLPPQPLPQAPGFERVAPQSAPLATGPQQEAPPGGGFEQGGPQGAPLPPEVPPGTGPRHVVPSPSPRQNHPERAVPGLPQLLPQSPPLPEGSLREPAPSMMPVPVPVPVPAPVPVSGAVPPSASGAVPPAPGAVPSVSGAVPPPASGALPSVPGALPSVPGALPSTTSAVPDPGRAAQGPMDTAPALVPGPAQGPGSPGEAEPRTTRLPALDPGRGEAGAGADSAPAAVPGAPHRIPPVPTRPPAPAPSAAGPGSGDPHAAISAAVEAGRHGEADALAAHHEQVALRAHGHASEEALHWIEVRADLAMLAGDPVRSCRSWLTVASARLSAGQTPDTPAVEAAVDRAHHQWGLIHDASLARELGSFLAELRGRVPGRRRGALENVHERLRQLQVGAGR